MIFEILNRLVEDAHPRILDDRRVDYDVDVAELCVDFAAHGADGGIVRDVSLNGGGAATHRLDLRDELVGFTFVFEIMNGDVRAALG